MIRRLTGEVKRKGPARINASPSLTHNHYGDARGRNPDALGIYTGLPVKGIFPIASCAVMDACPREVGNCKTSFYL